MLTYYSRRESMSFYRAILLFSLLSSLTFANSLLLMSDCMGSSMSGISFSSDKSFSSKGETEILSNLLMVCLRSNIDRCLVTLLFGCRHLMILKGLCAEGKTLKRGSFTSLLWGELAERKFLVGVDCRSNLGMGGLCIFCKCAFD